jgi:microsomal dipeptidase-like Zn-dependent dipeptidase
MRSLRVMVGIFLVLFLAQALGKWYVGRVDQENNQVVNGAALPELTPGATGLHSSLLVADLHADPLLWPRDLMERHGHGHIDLPRLIEGNVALQVFGVVTKTPNNLNYQTNTAYTDDIKLLAIAAGWPWRSWRSLTERALYMSRKLHQLQEDSSGSLVVIRNRGDLQRLLDARQAGESVTGGLLGLEGAHAIEGSLENLVLLHEAGFRMFGLAHFFDNEVSGSAHGVGKRGLTTFGRQAVQKAQQLGMVIDLSHASDSAVKWALRESSLPVVFSHSGIRATCEQQGRNLDDRTLRRLRRNGGVVGIGLWPYAICGDELRLFFDAVDHAVKVAGVNHVGLGSDFDGYITTPIDSSQWAHVTAGLLERGYSEKDVRKLMGGNFIRVLMKTLPED